MHALTPPFIQIIYTSKIKRQSWNSIEKVKSIHYYSWIIGGILVWEKNIEKFYNRQKQYRLLYINNIFVFCYKVPNSFLFKKLSKLVVENKEEECI